MAQIHVPVSPGELVDKLTILEIKSERITCSNKLANICRERELLRRIWQESPFAQAGLAELESELKAVNERLWDIEDAIREKERLGEFDADFIELARSVYLNNDERARLKREINERLGSELVEEKSYTNYRRG